MKSVTERVIGLASEIQQKPAKTFEEGPRAQFIHQQFLKHGVKRCFMDEVGNVYALFKGRGEKPPLVISAHLDTVFPADTPLSSTRTSEKISGPGIGDNSLGLAGLFGLIWALDAGVGGEINLSSLAGDLWLVANVAEEGLGDLLGMKAVVDRFGKKVSAYIILEGMSLGQIYHRGLGVRRYRISVHTQGGHSWVDYGAPSAIHILADIVTKINHIELPIQPRTSLNVGVISGGTSVNTIAASASLELDLRSENPSMLEVIAYQVELLVRDAQQNRGADTHVIAEIIGNRSAGEISADHPLVKLAMQCYLSQGVSVRLNIGSTDANIPLSRGIPAICVGLTTGGGAHTLQEYIDLKPVTTGLVALTSLVQSIFQQGIDN
jgi:acetylornithine deacetylase/succinyl-diaminopimelate desuccinylase-like protein